MTSPEPLLDLNKTPSMLEKALQFLETRGAVAEGILRKSADVEQVEYRLSSYYQGANHTPHTSLHSVTFYTRLSNG